MLSSESKFKRSLVLSILIGLALGSGYMTALRFWGPVGISELIFLFITCALLTRGGRRIFNFRRTLLGWSELYLIVAFFLICPSVTAFVYFFSHYSEMSDPVYVFSFAGGLILAFLIADEIRCGRIDMRIVAVTSLATFLVGNLVSVTIGYNAGSFRYTGFANNPNQLIFYIASISLLLAMYDKRFLVLGLPLLVYIGVLSGSDAYVASVTIGAISLVYVVFFYYQKTPLIFNIGVLSLLTAIVVISYGELVHEYLVQIWDEADEGGSRVALLVNAVRASLASPLFGWGAGSFSGIFSPFEGYEAHNNLLDLSMQFGFLVPLAIYGVIIIAMTEALKRRQYVIFAFIVSYLVSGIFHFSARHFVFWVEFGVFLAYISSPRNSVSGRLDEPSAKRVSCAE